MTTLFCTHLFLLTVPVTSHETISAIIKARIAFVSASALALGVLTGGCATTSTGDSDSSGQHADDVLITNKVQNAIWVDSTLRSLEIQVETVNAVVHLSGFVDTRSRSSPQAKMPRLLPGEGRQEQPSRPALVGAARARYFGTACAAVLISSDRVFVLFKLLEQTGQHGGE